jgi:hypothetical protein
MDESKRQPFPSFAPAGYTPHPDAKTNYLEPVGFVLQSADILPPATLTVTSVFPNPVAGSNTPQQFTISGVGFSSASTVTFRSQPPNGGGQIFPEQPINQRDSSHLVLFPTFGTTPSPWTVEVLNGAQSSRQFIFSVAAPNANPVITSVSPNPVPGSTAAQQFVINGSGFTPASTVTFRSLPAGGGGQTYPNQPIGSASSTQLILFPNLGTAASQWSVEVLNGTVSSGQFVFSVK